MNGLSCVKGEIHNVLAVLRITGRSSSSFFDFSNNSDHIEILRHKLLAAFKELHLFLGFHADLNEIDATVFLRPFLDVILSDIKGVDVMNVTLTSIHKFLLYSLINESSPKCESAMHDILCAILNAKFDDHSRSDKELIDIRLMEVLLETLRCPAGYMLSNDDVCLSVERCFFMRAYHRNISSNNGLMVRYTENVLIQMILMIFSKLESISKNASMGGFTVSSMERIFLYLTHLINPNVIDTSADIREFGLRLINVALETSGNNLNSHPSLIAIICDDLCRQLLTNSQSQHFNILSLTLRVIFDLFNAVKEAIRVQLEVFFISIHLRIAESDSSSFQQKELVLESIVEFCREPDLIIGLYTNYDCQVGSTHLFHDLCKFLSQQATPNDESNMNELHLIAAEGILAIIDCLHTKFVDCLMEEKVKEKKEKKEEMLHIKMQQKKKRKFLLAARHFNNRGAKCFDYLQEIGILNTPLTAQNVSSFLHNNPYIDKIQIGEFLGKNKEFNTAVLDEYIASFDIADKPVEEAMRYFLESFMLRGEAQQIERIIEKMSETMFKYKCKDSPMKSKDGMFLLCYSMIQLNTDAHNSQIKNKMTFESYGKNLKGLNDGSDFPEKFLWNIYHSITANEIKIRSGDLRDIFDNANHSTFFSDNDGDDTDNDVDDNNSNYSASSSSLLYQSNVFDVKRSEWMHVLKQSQTFGKFSTIAVPTNGAEMFNILWEPALSILQFHLRSAKHPKVLDRVVQGIQTLARIAHCYQIRSAFNAIIHSLCNDLMLCLLQFGRQNELLSSTFVSNISSDNKGTDDDASDEQLVSVPYFLSQKADGSDNQDNMNGNGSYNNNGSNNDVLALDIRLTFTIKIFFGLVKDYGSLLMTDGWSSVVKVLLWLFHLDLIPENEFKIFDFTDADGLVLPSISDALNDANNLKNDDDALLSVDAVTSWISNTFGSLFVEDGPNDPLLPANLNKNTEKLQNPKCQIIIESVSECQLSSSIFDNSCAYHQNTLQHLIRTLITLSSSDASHTITSLDAEPISTSKLMDSMHNNAAEMVTQTSAEIDYYSNSLLMDDGSNAFDDEKTGFGGGSTNKRRKHVSRNQDVICLPLTIDMKIFCLERMNETIIANIDRIPVIWDAINEHFQSLIVSHNHSPYFFERIIVSIFKLIECSSWLKSKDICQFLNLFSSLNDGILHNVGVGRRIVAGCKLLVQNENNNNKFEAENDWKILISLMKRFNAIEDKQCCLEAFQLIELIAKCHISASNFNCVIGAFTIFGFADSSAPVHCTRVIEVILSLHQRLNELTDNPILLAQMWHKTLQNIAFFGSHSDYITRRFAINSLHKALLQFPIELESKHSAGPAKLLFESILLPLLVQLTKVENDYYMNAMRSSEELDDLRSKLLTLIFQVWLHQLPNMLTQLNDFHRLWFKFLVTIRKFLVMVSGQNNSNNLITHCIESLKNVILVFQSTNLFDKLCKQSKTDVWSQTWNILSDVTPNLKQQFVTNNSSNSVSRSSSVSSICE